MYGPSGKLLERNTDREKNDMVPFHGLSTYSAQLEGSPLLALSAYNATVVIADTKLCFCFV
jgi:hypothetical protein